MSQDFRTELERATRLHREGDTEKAIAIYRRLAKLRPGAFDVRRLLVFALLQAGRVKEAMASARRLREQNPKVPQAHLLFGASAQAGGDIPAALAAFETASELDPGLAEAHYLAGNMLGALTRYEEAVARFDQAVALDPRNSEARVNRAALLSLLGRDEAALADYVRLTELQPWHAPYFILKSRAQASLGRFAAAAESAGAALSLAPRDADALSALGTARLGLEDLRAALTAFELASASAPERMDLRAHVIDLQRRLGNLEAAEAACSAALAVAPGASSILLARAALRHEAGDAAGALSDLALVLADEPGHADAASLRELIVEQTPLSAGHAGGSDFQAGSGAPERIELAGGAEAGAMAGEVPPAPGDAPTVADDADSRAVESPPAPAAAGISHAPEVADANHDAAAAAVHADAPAIDPPTGAVGDAPALASANGREDAAPSVDAPVSGPALVPSGAAASSAPLDREDDAAPSAEMPVTVLSSDPSAAPLEDATTSDKPDSDAPSAAVPAAATPADAAAFAPSGDGEDVVPQAAAPTSDRAVTPAEAVAGSAPVDREDDAAPPAEMPATVLSAYPPATPLEDVTASDKPGGDAPSAAVPAASLSASAPAGEGGDVVPETAAPTSDRTVTPSGAAASSARVDREDNLLRSADTTALASDPATANAKEVPVAEGDASISSAAASAPDAAAPALPEPPALAVAAPGGPVSGSEERTARLIGQGPAGLEPTSAGVTPFASSTASSLDPTPAEIAPMVLDEVPARGDSPSPVREAGPRSSLRPADALHAAEEALSQGRWAEGWAGYEHRMLALPALPACLPRWDGRAAPASLLVVGEGGIGDELLFGRLLRVLADRGIATTLLTAPAHVALLSRIDARVRVIGDPAQVDLSHPGLAWVPLASLPLLIAPDPAGWPHPPYLSPDPVRVARSRRMLAEALEGGEDGPVIGLGWDAGADGAFPLAALEPVTQVPGVRLVSLAPPEAEAELADAPFGGGIILLPRDGDGLLADTAGLIQHLDLVMTGAGALAHLLGARGRAGVVVAPPHDWRWRQTSRFYPALEMRRFADPAAAGNALAAYLARFIASADR